jgi:DNA-binding NarL/FixJ family response regulator
MTGMDVSTSLRLLVADDHEMVLDMLEVYLSKSGGMAVTKAQSLDEALARITAQGPFDLVLLDWQMPGMNGLEGLRRALDHNGGRPVAILTGTPVLRMVEDILGAGAAGILLKSVPARSLTNAIRFMYAGEQYLPMELMRSAGAVARTQGSGPLSGVELAVLGGLASGRQNKEIALDLGLAEPTVKMHVTSICRKLSARNRTQAVVNARDMGLA